MNDDKIRTAQPALGSNDPLATADKIQGNGQALRPALRPGQAAAPGTRAASPAHEPKDSFREIVETVVFVIVLVLMLKTFVAEAFVIPTGSMATTLLGYHRVVTCPECGTVFTVNLKQNDEGPGQIPNNEVTKCNCPNCLLPMELPGQPQRRERDNKDGGGP